MMRSDEKGKRKIEWEGIERRGFPIEFQISDHTSEARINYTV